MAASRLSLSRVRTRVWKAPTSGAGLSGRVAVGKGAVVGLEAAAAGPAGRVAGHGAGFQVGEVVGHDAAAVDGRGVVGDGAVRQVEGVGVSDAAAAAGGGRVPRDG